MGQFVHQNSAHEAGLGSKGFFGALRAAVPETSLWVLRTAPFTDIQNVGGSPTRIVLLGQSGEIATSDNHGASWQPGSGFDANHVATSVAQNGAGLWVAVCTNGTTFTSTDGATWTISGAIANQGFPQVIFGGGVFLIGCLSSSQVTNVFTSPDGITWTAQPTTTPNQVAPLLYDGSDFLVGATDAGGANAVIAFSPTGAVWTQTVVSDFNPVISGIAFHAGTYLATNGAFPSTVQRSPSRAWAGTPITHPLSDNVAGVAFGEGVWCMVGDVSGGTIPQAATSPDLITWTLEDLKLGPTDFENVSNVVSVGGTLVCWSFSGQLSTRG